MGLSSKQLDEHGYALCCVCRRKFFLRELEEQCEFCGNWFCKDCAMPTPKGHGFGKVCKKCYNKVKNER